MIYVITGKKFNTDLLTDRYRVLQVGFDELIDSGFLRDNEGDNIAHKNRSYCELTGIYWIWKNIKSAETVGIVHYRRFFTTAAGDFFYTYFGIKPKLLKDSCMDKALKKYDVILPKRERIVRTLKQYYAELHDITDWENTGEIIREICPEYYDSFLKVSKDHFFYYGNMMICTRKIFDNYAGWLFPILEKLEQITDINKYRDDYNRRVFGFIAERLLQVYVYHNRLKVKEYPVFNTEYRRMNIFKKNLNRFYTLIGKERKK